MVDIREADYEIKLAILREKAKNIDLQIDDDIFRHIATNVIADVRELEGIFNRMIAKAKIMNATEITLELAAEAVNEIVVVA